MEPEESSKLVDQTKIIGLDTPPLDTDTGSPEVAWSENAVQAMTDNIDKEAGEASHNDEQLSGKAEVTSQSGVHDNLNDTCKDSVIKQESDKENNKCDGSILENSRTIEKVVVKNENEKVTTNEKEKEHVPSAPSPISKQSRSADDRRSRERRDRSRSRDRRRSDDKRNSGSHRSSSSSHHNSHRSSHSRSSRDHKSHKLRTYNVRIQTEYESILQETRSKTGETKRPKKTRMPWYPHPRILPLKHRKYFRIETDPNGGADVCHMYWDEISHLSPELRAEICLQFIKLTFSEDSDECAYHVIGIVHDAAEYLPDLVDYMADHYGNITVKTGSLTGRGTQSLTMANYRDEVYKSYSKGTFRYPPLQEISICGVQGEEVGAYFPDFVARLEESPTMKHVMPWSIHSVVATSNPRESNDGPIFWVRPGEQTLPSCEGARSKGRIAKGVSRLSEAREALFEDRTKPHADQIGIDGVNTDTAPTAAVGVLKAVVCGNKDDAFRATKDVIAFHARDYNALVDLLQLDLYEPPLKQCLMWLESGKLNSLRRQGIRFAHIQLYGNAVYYLPRKIIHQFQTTSAVASVAWHVRWKDYFIETGAPNLHHPTGLNKGAVYYERKNVPMYQPPIVEDMSDEEVYSTPRKYEKSASKTPRSRSKKLCAEGFATPSKQEKTETENILEKVRKFDVDRNITNNEDSTVESNDKNSCTIPEGGNNELNNVVKNEVDSTSAHLDALPPDVKDKDRRHSADSPSVQRVAERRSSLETPPKQAKSETKSSESKKAQETISKTVKPMRDLSKTLKDIDKDCTEQRVADSKINNNNKHGKTIGEHSEKKRSADIALNSTKVEKTSQDVTPVKKKRKEDGADKSKTYDILGDIMQQMDKHKSF